MEKQAQSTLEAAINDEAHLLIEGCDHHGRFFFNLNRVAMLAILVDCNFTSW